MDITKIDIKKELMKFYVWQRNNCNKVEELKDIEKMVDIYMDERFPNKSDDTKICKGSMQLGTGCGKCKRCKREIDHM